MVARLLELHQRRQDDSRALDPLCPLCLLEHLVDDRLVKRRLLRGQMAVDPHLDLVREVADDLLVGLQPAQDERAGRLAQACRRMLVAPPLDRRRVAALERRGRPEQPRVEEVHDRVQLGQAVLDRCACQRDPVARGQRADRAGLLGVPGLDVLRLVERDSLPLHAGERLAVARRERVGSDHQIGASRSGRELAALQSLRAVMDEHAQAGREPLGFALPVADH